MKTSYADALAAVSRHRGVLGAMVVDADDDIIVDAAVRHGVKASTVAALGASIYRRACQSAGAAGLGGTTFLRMEAEGGHIFAAGRGGVGAAAGTEGNGGGGLVLIALAESSVNVGLVRLEMLKAAAGLA